MATVDFREQASSDELPLACTTSTTTPRDYYHPTLKGEILKALVLEGIRRVARAPWVGQKLGTVGKVLFLASRTGLGGPDVNGEDELIRRLVRSHDESRPFVFVDVGANVGDRTAFLLTTIRNEAEVHAFEPTPHTFASLSARFGGDSRVRVVCSALSDVDGSAMLRDYGGTSGTNSLVREQYHEGETQELVVSTMTGDAYCEQQGVSRVDFLKIDVEGHEWNVIHGLSRMFQSHRIGAVQFEYGFINATTGHLMRDYYRLFESFGYVMGPVRPRGPEFRPLRAADNNFDSGPNFVAALPEVAEAIS